MSDEEHGHEGEAPGVPGDGAAVRDAAAESDDGTVRGTEKAGDDGVDCEAAGDEITDPGTEADDAPPEEAVANHVDELAEAQRAAAEHLDRALRAQAELENVRRRLERDLQNAHKFALERFVSELLPVKDSLELGLAASAEKEAGAAGIVEGVQLTLRMLEQAMEKFGVRTVDPAGEPFDPEFHQAMTMQASDTAESGTVLTVVQKGYLLNERLVRPAMVIVAK